MNIQEKVSVQKKLSHSSTIYLSLICNTKIDISEIKILDQTNFKFSLRILEPLYIHEEKPNLNDMHSVTPLLVVRSFLFFVSCIVYP